MKVWFSLMILAAFSAQGATVTCSGVFKGKTQSVTVKMDAKGKILPWAEGRWAKSTSDYFLNFSDNIEESGVEYDNDFWGKGGYYIVVVGTTADEQTLGINLKLKKGFFKYRDTGSGSGNFGFPLTCKVK